MILIISEEYEFSTDNVMEWLLSMKKSVFRINTGRTWQLEYIEQSNGEVHCAWSFDKKLIFSKSIDAVWFRRGYLQKYFYQLPKDESITEQVEKNLRDETETLKNFIYAILMDKKSLNRPDCYNMNKLIALKNAVDSGLEIPNTLITRHHEQLKIFEKQYGDLISKPIQDCLIINGKKFMNICKVDAKKIKTDTFPYTLVQKEIPKRVELRVFYLNGKCYTAATFPLNEQEIDGRVVIQNNNKLRRTIPFCLPEEQQKKIHKFMELSSLNSGSLDIILTPDNRYVFLEVNPVGQFDYVSKFCNYYIERDIAKYLGSN